MSRSREYALFVVSGAVAGLGFVEPILFPSVFLGLALLLNVLRRRERCIFSDFTHVFVAGVAFNLIGLAWHVDTLPLTWLGIPDTALALALVALNWLVNAFILAIGWGVFGVVHARLSSGSWLDVVLVPSLWVLAEVVSVYAFAIATLGPGSLFGPHFTINFVGYLVGHSPLILQTASLGGVFALSWIGVFLAAIAARTFLAHGRFRFLGAVVLAGMAAILYLPLEAREISPGTPAVQLAVVRTDTAPTLKPSEDVTDLAQLHALLEEKIISADEAVILPEGTRFMRYLQDTFGDSWTDNLPSGLASSSVIIDSHTARDRGGALHSEIVYVQGGLTRFAGYKQFLVAYGEYMPYVSSTFLRFVGQADTVRTIQEARGMQRGGEPALVEIPGGTLGVLFCSDALSPMLYRTAALSGADIFVNISSQSWFHGSPIVENRMRSIARVRAVESGRWYVQATNAGSSYVLDNRGVEIASLSDPGIQLMRVQVPLLERKTMYQKFGLFVLVLPFFLTCVFVVVRFRR